MRVQLAQLLELGSPLVDVLASAAAEPRGAEGAEGAEAAGAGARALGAEDAQRVVRQGRAAPLGLPQQRPAQRRPGPRPHGAVLGPAHRARRAALHRHLQLCHVVGVLQGETGHGQLIPWGFVFAGDKEGMIPSQS